MQLYGNYTQLYGNYTAQAVQKSPNYTAIIHFKYNCFISKYNYFTTFYKNYTPILKCKIIILHGYNNYKQ